MLIKKYRFFRVFLRERDIVYLDQYLFQHFKHVIYKLILKRGREINLSCEEFLNYENSRIEDLRELRILAVNPSGDDVVMITYQRERVFVRVNLFVEKSEKPNLVFEEVCRRIYATKVKYIWITSLFFGLSCSLFGLVIQTLYTGWKLGPSEIDNLYLSINGILAVCVGITSALTTTYVWRGLFPLFDMEVGRGVDRRKSQAFISNILIAIGCSIIASALVGVFGKFIELLYK